MVKQLTGGYKVIYHSKGPKKEACETDSIPEREAFEIDFTPPFERIPMIPTLEKELGVIFPDPTTLHTDGGTHFNFFS